MGNISHKERVIDLDLLKLLGIVIVIVGFVMKMDSILIIMAAAIVTALVSGMDLVTFLETLGSSFVSNRSMCTFIIVFLVTGTLERNGLKQAASHLMTRFKNATAGMVIGIYGVFRLFFAAFNISFGGAAGFIRPIVMPMATAAVERDGHSADVEECVSAVDADEMSVEGLAEPITELGENHPVLEFPVLLLIQGPRVISAFETECRLVAYGEFNAEIRRGRQPIERIGLDRNVLGLNFFTYPTPGTERHEHGEKHFSHSIYTLPFLLANLSCQERPKFLAIFLIATPKIVYYNEIANRGGRLFL